MFRQKFLVTALSMGLLVSCFPEETSTNQESEFVDNTQPVSTNETGNSTSTPTPQEALPSFADMEVEGEIFTFAGFRNRDVSDTDLTGTWLGIGVVSSSDSWEDMTREVRTIFQVRPNGQYVKVANCAFRGDGMTHYDLISVQNGINVYWVPVSNTKMVAANDVSNSSASDYDTFEFEALKISDDYDTALISESLYFEKAGINENFSFGHCIAEYVSKYISKTDSSELFQYWFLASGTNHSRNYETTWSDAYHGSFEGGSIEAFVDLLSGSELYMFNDSNGTFSMSLNNVFNSSTQVLNVNGDGSFHESYNATLTFVIPDN